ncbi:hypothetical protein Tco_1516782 [Tanacetum coccineum]
MVVGRRVGAGQVGGESEPFDGGMVVVCLWWVSGEKGCRVVARGLGGWGGGLGGSGASQGWDGGLSRWWMVRGIARREYRREGSVESREELEKMEKGKREGELREEELGREEEGVVKGEGARGIEGGKAKVLNDEGGKGRRQMRGGGGSLWELAREELGEEELTGKVEEKSLEVNVNASVARGGGGGRVNERVTEDEGVCYTRVLGGEGEEREIRRSKGAERGQTKMTREGVRLGIRREGRETRERGGGSVVRKTEDTGVMKVGTVRWGDCEVKRRGEKRSGEAELGRGKWDGERVWKYGGREREWEAKFSRGRVGEGREEKVGRVGEEREVLS